MSETVHTSTIRQIPADRGDLYIFEVTGHMNAEDVRRVYATLNDAYDKLGTIDLMVKLTDYEGFDWKAAFADTTYTAKTRSLKHIRRYAVVGGPAWIRSLIDVFDPFFHVEMQTFETGQDDEALAWLNEKPAV